jgi:hypothetical protein
MHRQIQAIRKGKNRYILEGTEIFNYNFVCNANHLHLIHIMKIQNGKYSTKVAIWFNKLRKSKGRVNPLEARCGPEGG